MTRMKFSSFSTAVAAVASRGAWPLAAALAASAVLAACAADGGAPRTAPTSGDAKGLAAELDALQRQPGPASDEVIASLERALREQREKRARAVVAAGTTAVIPSGASDNIAAPAVPARSAAPAPVPPPSVAVVAPAPAKPQRMTRAQARAASAVAARQAAAARQSTPVATQPADVLFASNATPLPPLHPVEQPVAAPMMVPTAAAMPGPPHTPMSHIDETHLPVDELYARARQLELQSQVPAAIALYREASQRGHAPSSQRLMELYADGAPGVARDYRVAVFFKERAVQQGAAFDPVWRH